MGPGLLAYCLEFVNGFNDRGQRLSKSAEPVVIDAADSGVSEQACQRPVDSEPETVPAATDETSEDRDKTE